jgi:DNA-binding response OmpR family regulator
MDPLRVLIVENEIIIALELEAIVEELAGATCILRGSVAGAKKALRNEQVDLALLDIDVLNGDTYDVARLLRRDHVPCVFVSSTPPREVPKELREIPFVKKPFRPSEVGRALEAALR